VTGLRRTGKPTSPPLPLPFLVSYDTRRLIPSANPFCRVAPSVRFSFIAIFRADCLSINTEFAIHSVGPLRRSSYVHCRNLGAVYAHAPCELGR